MIIIEQIEVKFQRFYFIEQEINENESKINV